MRGQKTYGFDCDIGLQFLLRRGPSQRNTFLGGFGSLPGSLRGKLGIGKTFANHHELPQEQDSLSNANDDQRPGELDDAASVAAFSRCCLSACAAWVFACVESSLITIEEG
jgi:hypothetical protein